MIFGFFAVPPLYQHRVLFWGILGALVMRGVMIGLGATLIAEFHWILYVFGVFLILTGDQDAVPEDGAHRPEPEHRGAADAAVLPGHRALPRRALRRAGRCRRPRTRARSRAAAMPDEAVEQARRGTLLLTPLALALIMVETTDLIFAVDSIPAIFAITGDPVPGLHQQRVRDPRPALALLRAGRDDRRSSATASTVLHPRPPEPGPSSTSPARILLIVADHSRSWDSRGGRRAWRWCARGDGLALLRLRGPHLHPAGVGPVAHLQQVDDGLGHVLGRQHPRGVGRARDPPRTPCPPSPERSS